VGRKGHLTKPVRAAWLFFVRRGETLQHLAVIIATIIAALWSYNLFESERQSMPHLGIEIQSVQQAIPKSDSKKIVFLDLILTNRGKRKLQADEVPTSQIAYQDPGEVLQYPCGLQVRQIMTAVTQTNAALDFFNNTNELVCPPGIPAEVDLLSEYELLAGPQGNTATPQFWMEPGEQYHLGATLILPKGSYLVRAHFVGNKRSDEEFWSRITFLQVD
jgi:hypothetical protein